MRRSAKILPVLSRIAAFLLLLLSAAVSSYPQDIGFFNVRSIISDVQRQFKLKKNEVRDIKPLIIRENEDVVSVYSRYSREELGYSTPLWQELIKRRLDFEARMAGSLKSHQRSAMYAARTALEARVLSFLADDYAFYLGDFLELNGLEMEGVQVVLHSEFERKHKLMIRHISSPKTLQTELEKISDETERHMKLILSPEQFRDYRSLSEKGNDNVS